MNQQIFQSNEADDEHQQSPPIELILSIPIILIDQIHHAVHHSKSYKLECNQLAKQLHHLSHIISRFNDSTPLYEPPVRRIFINIIENLNRALTLIRKCHHRGIILYLFSIVNALDFRKLFELLDVSIHDVKWLIRIFDAANGGIVFSLPAIVRNDMCLAWIWSCIALLHTRKLSLKIDAAKVLSTLACDTDRNKIVIVEEGGISPLLKLLKDELSPETQIAGAVALFNIVNDQTRARSVLNEHGVPILAQALRNSYPSVQIEVANLIARVTEHDCVFQEGFGRKNVIETIVMILSMKVLNDECDKIKNKVLGAKCCGALWMLARGNVANCRRITETKGLRCLAKIIEKEKGEMQMNCLMTVVEITTVAEYNADIRRSAFKSNSPAAKAIVNQLLGLINESDNLLMKIEAIRAIGRLARSFTLKQTHVIILLVEQLCHMNRDVATESVIALGKFTCSENYLSAEHSKTIVEFKGVEQVMKMLTWNERTQYHALILLCYLAMHVKDDDQFEQEKVLRSLEGANRCFVNKYSKLRDLVAKAISHLNMFGY
ncbi:hypothetical protein QVD17_03993 [Tagetes erecta]|uniref:DUF7792 domain-containing protein n=1 Tax=Tagetes erecta TaxID=13708 RepID=A0AAD8LEM5_TARER|nr:hypothetical protein QVD17_03993 [Tagetes erecta]